MTRWMNTVALGLALGLTLVGCGHHRHHAHEAASPHERDRAYRYVTWKVDGALDDIDATDAQRDHVHDVKHRLYVEAKDVRQAARLVPREVLDELRRDEPDPERLHALVDARVEELRALLHNAADGLLELHEVLTPEQRDALISRIERRMGPR